MRLRENAGSRGAIPCGAGATEEEQEGQAPGSSSSAHVLVERIDQLHDQLNVRQADALLGVGLFFHFPQLQSPSRPCFLNLDGIPGNNQRLASSQEQETRRAIEDQDSQSEGTESE